MRVWRGKIGNNISIGLFAVVNDEYGLIGEGVKEKIVKEFEENFSVKFHKVSVLGTDLVGIFLIATPEYIIAPSILYEKEIEQLSKIRDVIVLDTKYNAIGNNILLGENAIAVNPKLEKPVKEFLARETKKPVYDLTIGKVGIVGAMATIYKNKILVGNEVREGEVKKLQKIFSPEVIKVGSINFGSPFIKSGLLVNKNGYAVGENTTGIEMSIIEETFF